MDPTVEQPAAEAALQLPEDVLRTPAGEPAAVVVRTGRGWTVLGAEPGNGLTLVEGMSLADLLAAELGVVPEPHREARRAARTGSSPAPGPGEDPRDPRDEEIAALRRTVGQLEHALASRVSVERAIGVLAERHGTTPREAFEQLRRHARSEGRPAQDLAAEVLDELLARAAGANAPCLGPAAARLAAPGLHPTGGQPAPRRVQRNGRRPGGDPVPGA
jgi:ANTAR domain